MPPSSPRKYRSRSCGGRRNGMMKIDRWFVVGSIVVLYVVLLILQWNFGDEEVRDAGHSPEAKSLTLKPQRCRSSCEDLILSSRDISGLDSSSSLSSVLESSAVDALFFVWESENETRIFSNIGNRSKNSHNELGGNDAQAGRSIPRPNRLPPLISTLVGAVDVDIDRKGRKQGGSRIIRPELNQEDEDDKSDASTSRSSQRGETNNNEDTVAMAAAAAAAAVYSKSGSESKHRMKVLNREWKAALRWIAGWGQEQVRHERGSFESHQARFREGRRKKGKVREEATEEDIDVLLDWCVEECRKAAEALEENTSGVSQELQKESGAGLRPSASFLAVFRDILSFSWMNFRFVRGKVFISFLRLLASSFLFVFLRMIWRWLPVSVTTSSLNDTPRWLLEEEALMFRRNKGNTTRQQNSKKKKGTSTKRGGKRRKNTNSQTRKASPTKVDSCRETERKLELAANGDTKISHRHFPERNENSSGAEIDNQSAEVKSFGDEISRLFPIGSLDQPSQKMRVSPKPRVDKIPLRKITKSDQEDDSFSSTSSHCEDNMVISYQRDRCNSPSSDSSSNDSNGSEKSIPDRKISTISDLFSESIQQVSSSSSYLQNHMEILRSPNLIPQSTSSVEVKKNRRESDVRGVTENNISLQNMMSPNIQKSPVISSQERLLPDESYRQSVSDVLNANSFIVPTDEQREIAARQLRDYQRVQIERIVRRRISEGNLLARPRGLNKSVPRPPLYKPKAFVSNSFRVNKVSSRAAVRSPVVGSPVIGPPPGLNLTPPQQPTKMELDGGSFLLDEPLIDTLVGKELLLSNMLEDDDDDKDASTALESDVCSSAISSPIPGSSGACVTTDLGLSPISEPSDVGRHPPKTSGPWVKLPFQLPHPGGPGFLSTEQEHSPSVTPPFGPLQNATLDLLRSSENDKDLLEGFSEDKVKSLAKTSSDWGPGTNNSLGNFDDVAKLWK